MLAAGLTLADVGAGPVGGPAFAGADRRPPGLELAQSDAAAAGRRALPPTRMPGGGLGAAGAPPVGAAGPPPMGAAGPPPMGAAGPPPLNATGGMVLEPRRIPPDGVSPDAAERSGAPVGDEAPGADDGDPGGFEGDAGFDAEGEETSPAGE